MDIGTYFTKKLIREGGKVGGNEETKFYEKLSVTANLNNLKNFYDIPINNILPL